MLEQKDLREKMADRVEVLDKVKKLFLMPKLEMLTTQQVADYYEVPLETVKSCYKYNRDEVNQDGVSLKAIKDFLKVKLQPLVKTQSKTVFRISDDITLEVPNRGLLMFSRRAILRIGMLLRDSKVAKEIRTQLLNTFEQATPEQRTVDIDEETQLTLNIVEAFKTGQVTDMLTASAELVAFHKRHIEALEICNTELSQNNKALAGEILEWNDRAKLNKAIRLIASACGTEFGYTWKKLYDELLYKHHIGLQMRGNPPYIQYIKEDEWKFVLQSISAICENSGISPSKIFEKAKLTNT